MDSIVFQCACGRRLKASHAAIGKTAECDSCGVRVVVPEKSSFGDQIEIGGEKIDTSRWLRARCACGKVLKAPPKMAGSSGACPRCGRTVKMPLALADNVYSSSSTATATALDLIYENDGTKMSSGETKASAGETWTSSLAMRDSSDETRMSSHGTKISSHKSPAGRHDSPSLGTRPTGLGGSSGKGIPFASSDMDSDSGTGLDALFPQKDDRENGALIRMTCQCGKVIKAPSSAAGKVGKCPRCGVKVTMRANADGSKPR